uniref:ATP synthase complex subunit 8 n=2 Tax=Polycheles TaxID=288635 RepID=A0A4Y5QJI5_9EUCA|nr:ATP synthase F0 subunit 8 [Polycheles baccatus]ART66020.1 ATP synthase F0 subunit 8 [Polycheles coccifer]QCX31768.1 ATP synthase F0 subunit 8 [Polycheles baccatus]
MPQMAPLMWTSLFAFFLLNFLLFFILTYFLQPPSKMKQQPLLFSSSQKNWKW